VIESSIADQFRPYLGPGEKIAWTGVAPQGLRFLAQDVLLVPFSILWGGFAIFWEASVIRSHAPFFFMLWGAPFVLIGVYMIGGRFVADAWIRGRTVYALTNERALILRRINGEKLLSASTGRATVKRLRDGRGALLFGSRMPSWRDALVGNQRAGLSIWMPSLSDVVQFLEVDDVMAVYHLALRNASPP
jgi:hypothetical protein